MLNIGCHLSTSAGFKAMGKVALSIGANTFQFFTRNPRGGAAKDMDILDVEGLLELAKENEFAPLLAHASYTLNVCSADKKVRDFAVAAMADDLERKEHLPGSYYNFHPGSHMGQGVNVGVVFIVRALNTVIKPEQKTTILLETMSGKGSEVGRTFEELRQIIDGVKHKEVVGVCLDTCHVYDGGYDIVNDLDGVLERFDEVIGLNRLYAVHLNDSKNPFDSHKDRHEEIGKGTFGEDGITHVINHPKLKHLPFYLETPNEIPGYEKEIAMLKKWYKE
ncbi:MAG: deoxyribonuclease IV [Prevotellaceae bacterium]|jgi:deoxyribonuclease-4|nr:deoxyribonuclease IV [Prevotellaceae bacterium]